MPLKVAFQMDHIARINIRGDSTFALMLEGERRGHAQFHYTPDRLSMGAVSVEAAVEEVKVRDVAGDHFTLGAKATVDLATFDVVHLRQDPPFDMGYITTTHLLERIAGRTLVVNDPAAVRNAPEKLFVTQFPALTPPTLITRDRAAIAAFRQAHGDIIVKPLYGNVAPASSASPGGDENLVSLLELFEEAFRGQPFVIQRYLPEVRQGDKRIILVEGERSAPSTVCRPPARRAPTCTSAAAPSRPTMTARDRKSATPSARRSANAACSSSAST